LEVANRFEWLALEYRERELPPGMVAASIAGHYLSSGKIWSPNRNLGFAAGRGGSGNVRGGFLTGKAGENHLAATVGGVRQKYFSTTLGGRFVDSYADNIAHEAKVGYVSLTPFIRKQVLKDAELIATKEIQGATWHFYRSATTGKAGPSAPLEKFLREHGIKIVKHY